MGVKDKLGNTWKLYKHPEGEKRKKKFKKNSYRRKIGEAIDKTDLETITKLIRNVVGDILRDIWLKRTAWK